MLILINVIKNGVKVVAYVAMNKETLAISTLNKDEVLALIEENKDAFVNMHLQIYKEQKLLRYDLSKVGVIDISKEVNDAKEFIKQEKEKEKAKEKDKKQEKKVKVTRKKAESSTEEKEDTTKKEEVKTEEKVVVPEVKSGIDEERRVKILGKISATFKLIHACRSEVVDDKLYLYDWGAWINANTLSSRTEASKEEAIKMAMADIDDVEAITRCEPVNVIVIELQER